MKGPLHSTTTEAATTVDAVIAIFSASPYQKAGSAVAGVLSWLRQPPSYEIDEQIAAHGYKQGQSHGRRRAEPLGGEIEPNHRDGNTTRADDYAPPDGRGDRTC